MFNWSKTQQLAATAMLAAIIFLMTFLQIGFLPLPFLRPTTLHIPVIVGAILLGPKYGAFLGFFFGLASMLFATFMSGAATAFVFSPFINLPGTENGSILSIIVAFVPRILVGVVAWYVFAGVRALTKNKLSVLSFAAAGIAGSLTNTILVMHFIFLFFGQSWNAARTPEGEAVIEMTGGALYAVIIGIVAVNGVPEAIAAAVLVAAIAGALSAVIRRSHSERL